MPRRFVVNCSVHVRIGLQVVGRDTVRAFHEGVVNSESVTWFHDILINVVKFTSIGETCSLPCAVLRNKQTNKQTINNVCVQMFIHYVINIGK